MAETRANFGGFQTHHPDTYNPTEERVTMIFPVALNLTVDNGKVIHFEPGPNEVPVSLQDNWYLKANKVKFYDRAKQADESATPVEDPDVAKVTDHHLVFLRSRGFEQIEDLDGARKYVKNLTPDERHMFFRAAEQWKPTEEQQEEENLQKMLKDDLAKLAKDKYKLKLSPKATKVDIIKAIEDVQIEARKQ